MKYKKPFSPEEKKERHRTKARQCTRSVYLGTVRDQNRWDTARKMAAEEGVPMGKYISALIAQDLNLE